MNKKGLVLGAVLAFGVVGCGKSVTYVAAPEPAITIPVFEPPTETPETPSACDAEYSACIEEALKKDALKKTQPHVDKCARERAKCED